LPGAHERVRLVMRVVYLLAHLPKTGGTTINVHLARHLRWDEEFVHLGPWGEHRRRAEGRRPISERTPQELRRVRVVSGHQVDGSTHDLFPDAEARHMTIIREPAARLVSQYNYRMSAPAAGVVPFEDWYAGIPRNPATRWLRRRFAPGAPFRDLLAVLRDFWFVGTTEQLDEDLPGLFAAIGVPQGHERVRVAGGDDGLDGLEFPDDRGLITVRLEVNDSIREMVHRDHPKDLRLWRFAQRRRARAPWR
jgi:hypothetical protein